MILERLRVESLGCIKEAVDITFTKGINVIAGNNETGKSTLVTALHHGLFTPYGSQAKEIRDLQPWGTLLAPEVEVELSIGGVRYLIQKRFLYEAHCRLHEYRNGKPEKIADGDRADDWIRRLLLAEKPSGAAKPSNRGLARLLWLPQDEHLAVELDGAVLGKVESCLGVATLDSLESSVVRSIAEQYEKIWTKTGKFTKASGIADLEERIALLAKRHKELEKTLGQMEQHGRDLEQVRDELAVLSRERAQVLEQQEATVKEAESVKNIRYDWEKAKEQLEARQKALELADDRRHRFKEAEGIITKARDQLAILDRQLADEDAKKEQLTKARQESNDSLEELQAAWQGLDREIARARLLNRALDDRVRLRSMKKRLASLEALSADIASKQKALAQMPAPHSEDVENARMWERNIERLTGRLEAVGLSLSFKAYSRQTGAIAKDNEEPRRFEIGSNESIALKAIGKASLVLDGVGELELSSGAEEATRLQQELDDERRRLRDLFAPFSVLMATDLERLRQERIQAKQEIDGLLKRLDNELGEQRDLDAVSAAVAQLARTIESACIDLGMEDVHLEDLEPIDLGKLEKQNQALLDQIEAVRRDQELLTGEIEKFRDIRQKFENRKIKLETEMSAAEKVMAEIVGAVGEAQAIEIAYHEARRERDAAQAKEQELAGSLPKGQDDPGIMVARLAAQLKEIGEDMKRLEYREARLKADIEIVAEQGIYEELIRTSESLEQSRREYDRLLKEAKVIQLLNELIKARRQNMIEGLTGPVSRRVTNYFERISGHVDRHVVLDESLQPSTLQTLASEDISPDLLSTGAKEQLYVLTRLALAKYLAESEGPMLFVVDDRLVNTDQVRHRRLIELLEEAEAHLQIVILTCHQQRYRGVQNATYHAMG